MRDRLPELKEAIELNYYCRAEHVRSTAVIEMCGREKVWQGVVEVFDVDCHLPVKHCYAWSETAGSNVTVLELPPVRSAGTAVRSAIVSAGSKLGTLTPFAQTNVRV